MLTEPPRPEYDDEIGIIKGILNVMEKSHPSMITLTYDQIMEVVELIYHRIDFCDDVYDEYEDNPKNIRLLCGFDMIK